MRSAWAFGRVDGILPGLSWLLVEYKAGRVVEFNVEQVDN